MTFKVTVLGCSGSNGVPATGYGWGKCDKNEPKNHRTRPGVMLEKDGFRLVIDAGPDIRQQLTREQAWTIDAVLFTHPHFDHIGGVGDLFGIAHARKQTLPFYTYDKCATEIYERNRYAFDRVRVKDTGDNEIHLFSLNVVPVAGNLQIGPFKLQTMSLDHYDTVTMGVRCGDFAYLIDFYQLEDAQIQQLQGLQTLIIDGNNPVDNPRVSLGHVDSATAAVLAQKIGAKQTYLSSLPGWHDYATLAASLPAGVAPAYDGLNFTANAS